MGNIDTTKLETVNDWMCFAAHGNDSRSESEIGTPSPLESQFVPSSRNPRVDLSVAYIWGTSWSLGPGEISRPGWRHRFHVYAKK